MTTASRFISVLIGISSIQRQLPAQLRDSYCILLLGQRKFSCTYDSKLVGQLVRKKSVYRASGFRASGDVHQVDLLTWVLRPRSAYQDRHRSVRAACARVVLPFSLLRPAYRDGG